MVEHRILVSGAAGFIGSNLVNHLLRTQSDIEIVGLDNLTYAGNLANLDAARKDGRFSLVVGDICDPKVVGEAMMTCDRVVHLAAESHVDRSIEAPAVFADTNFMGTLVMLDAARSNSIKRFIQVSTDEVYGDLSMAGKSCLPCPETDPLRPCSPYAASKAAGDCLALSYWATYGVPLVITRCVNNYGPNQHTEKQIPTFITRALRGQVLPIYGKGQEIREWIHVEDHCSALALLLSAPDEMVLGEVFNIGTGDERSTLRNARAVLRHLNLPEDHIEHVADRPGHVRRHAVDSTKIREHLGWSPRIDFNEGLADTIGWYQRRPGGVIVSTDPTMVSQTSNTTQIAARPAQTSRD